MSPPPGFFTGFGAMERGGSTNSRAQQRNRAAERRCECHVTTEEPSRPRDARLATMQVRLASAADVATLHERLNSAVAETLKARLCSRGAAASNGPVPGGPD